MTHYAVEWIAQAPTAKGYRVRFVAAASKSAAEFRMCKEHRAGFQARVIQVTRREHDDIINGDWHHYQAFPELSMSSHNDAFQQTCLDEDADWYSRRHR
jgi:hypothetical protein